ncbi:uncharacterized protein LOC134554255 [Prinia subflava]|uniref:uncharacterized protein LOC134554255 n=1 Tax=Prinia subflava TaxID=208062 RepID=UPI002FE2E6F8
MGACVSGKKNREEHREHEPRSIPPGSPLGQLLDKWKSCEDLKELDKRKMVNYCMEVWPTLDLIGGWPWCGTRDRWMCTQLRQHLESQKYVDAEQLQYVIGWEKAMTKEKEVKICKLKEMEEDRDGKEAEPKVPKWDPLDYLPPPSYPNPQLTQPPSSLPASILTQPVPSPSSSSLPPLTPISSPPLPPPLTPSTLPVPVSNNPQTQPMPHLSLPTPTQLGSSPFLPPVTQPMPLSSLPPTIQPGLSRSTPSPTQSSSLVTVPLSVSPGINSPYPVGAQHASQGTPAPSEVPTPPVKWGVDSLNSTSAFPCSQQNGVQVHTPQAEDYQGGPSKNTRSKVKLFPLREVPMGGMIGGVGFVNAPLTASEVRSFKKELKNLVEDPVGVSKQVDQFLGPNIYTWEEMNSILGILFDPEEVRLIRVAGIRAWERDNRMGPPGDHKLPLTNPGWDPNEERDRRNMDDYRTLIIKGIKEAVPRSSNTKLAFDGAQEKEETPSAWLSRLRQNFQQYSSLDPDSLEGQTLLKVQFVTKSWPDIRRKIEKMEDWQEKEINELLKEALRVYLRRDEEKARSKAKVMVAVARESAKGNPVMPRKPNGSGSQGKGRKGDLAPWETPQRPGEGRKCFYCGEVGHLRKNCNKESFDAAIAKEQDLLEKVLRGDDDGTD